MEISQDWHACCEDVAQLTGAGSIQKGTPMQLRTLLLPALLLAGFFALDVDTAEARGGRAVVHGRHAGPHGRRLHRHRGAVVVGADVAIPVRSRGGYYREVVEYVGGYNETRTREVEVPGRQIGWDMDGNPIHAGSRIEIQTYEVWIPRRRVVRRVWVPARPVATVRIGGTWRVR